MGVVFLLQHLYSLTLQVLSLMFVQFPKNFCHCVMMIATELKVTLSFTWVQYQAFAAIKMFLFLLVLFYASLLVSSSYKCGIKPVLFSSNCDVLHLLFHL